MPEALTESFCERCGTRYEFKAPTRLNPLRRSRGLVSGLRNYIMSQDALADAVGDAMRSEEERLAARQLEAFHNSFNFCIDCRQYTCNSCWNEGAGRCRSCVPVPGKDDLMERLEASFAAGAGTEASASGGVVDGGLSDAARAVGAEAWPSADIRNGHQVLDWPAAELSDDSDVGRRGATQSPSSIDNWTADASPPTLSDLVWPSTRRQASEPEPEPAVADIEPEPAVAEFEPEPAVAEFEPEPAVADIEPEPAVAEFEPEPAPGVAPVPLSWDDDQPFELVAPEQPAWMAGLDDPSIRFAEAPLVGEEELPPVSAPAAGMTTASEQEPEGLEISPEPVVVDLAAQPEPTVAEVEPILAEVQPEWSAAGIGQTPEPEPVAAEVAPEPEPEPVAAEAQPEPVVVEQPPRILRPLERRDAAPAPRPVAPRSDERIAAAAERQDPALAARRAQLELLGLDQSGVESPAAQPPEVLPYRSSGAGIHPAEAAGATPGLRSAAAIRASMWDASSREVAGAASAIGIQNCGGCGLSLSATARFCRRCGTRQARSA